MKPQILKITGINSFNEEQIIDFSKLTFDGIFGIFGDTGSGKSTIIDSITLSLYGRIVRHKSKNKNGDFINLNRKNAKVEFQFSIQEDNKRKSYSIFRQFKKDKEGNIKSDISRLINLDNNEIISDKKTEIEEAIINIIGLNYDDFTKAVVLPQGKFSEFLLLENTEKRKMLERIFGLEKYGEKLTKKINENKLKQQKEVDYIKEKIGEYENITPDIISNNKKLLLKEEENLKIYESNFEKILEKQKFLKNNFDLKEEYISYKNNFNEIWKYKDKVEKMKEDLENSKKAKIVKPYILEIYSIREEISNLKNDYNNIEKQYIDLENKYLFKDKEYKQIDNIYKNELPNLEKIKLKLENCIKLDKDRKNIKYEILKLEENILEKKDCKSNYEERISNILKEKKSIQKNIKELEDFKEKNKIDILFKIELEKGISIIKDINIIENSLKLNQDKLKSYNNIIIKNKEILNSNEGDKQKIINEILNILITNKIILYKDINNIQNNIIEIDSKIEKMKNEINILENQIKLQENKEFVKELIEKLNDGEKCPICGSLDHPSPAKIFFDTMLDSLIKQKDEFLLNIEMIEKDKINLLKKETILKKYIQDIEIRLQKFDLSEFKEKITKQHIFNDDNIFNEIELRNKKIISINENIVKYTATINNTNEIINSINEENKTNIKQKKDLEKSINEVKQKLNLDNILEKYEELIEIEKENNLKEEQLINLRKDLKLIIEEEEEIRNLFSEIEKSIVSNNVSLEEKKHNLLNIEKNIQENSYGKDFNEYFIEISNRINKIIKDEKIIKNEYENICLKKEDIKIKFENIKIKKELNIKKNEEKTKNLEKLLLENNVLEDEVLSMCLKDEEEIYLETKINSFKQKIDDCKINIERINKKFYEINKFDIEEVDQLELNKQLNNLIKEKQDLENLKKDTISNITKLIIEIKNGENALEITGNLQKELRYKMKRLDILDELSKLNKGGVFVEYVANSQLKHIVLDASKRLESMSNNKYSLELIENEFTIKDHYNGGINRTPRSLSGGEIFMASLSLALALSSKIQLKNKSPLEVFFLDEGFGTLDSNLLDTVISTLEQLQSDNIDVGIITHVEEIKNRVQNKIIVKNNDMLGATINFI